MGSAMGNVSGPAWWEGRRALPGPARGSAPASDAAPGPRRCCASRVSRFGHIAMAVVAGEAGVRYRPRWQDRRFEDYDTVIAAAEAGLGVALLRMQPAGARPERGRLARLGNRAAAHPAAHYLRPRAPGQRGGVLRQSVRLLHGAEPFPPDHPTTGK